MTDVMAGWAVGTFWLWIVATTTRRLSPGGSGGYNGTS